MKSSDQTDMFDGTYDNPRTNRREVYRDGKLARYAAKNCCGDSQSFWRELREPWGHFAAPPYNFGQVSACADS